MAAEKKARQSTQATINVLRKLVNKTKTFIGLVVCAEIFTNSDRVAQQLQKSYLTTSQALTAAVELLKKTLQRIRSAIPENEMISTATREASSIDLEALSWKHVTKTPATLRHESWFQDYRG